MNLMRLAGEGGDLWRDVRSDRAGLLPRIALSVAAALLLLSATFFIFGIIDVNGRVEDGHVAVGLGLAGAIWCAVLIRIWLRYRRFGRLIIGALAIVAIWVLIIPLAIFIDSMTYDEEFLIAGVVFFGFGATAMTLLLTLYGMRRGKPVYRSEGVVNVICPECDYDLTGLRECRCPECGFEFTIDQLIAKQGYDRPRPEDADTDRQDKRAEGRSTEAPPASPGLSAT